MARSQRVDNFLKWWVDIGAFLLFGYFTQIYYGQSSAGLSVDILSCLWSKREIVQSQGCEVSVCIWLYQKLFSKVVHIHHIHAQHEASSCCKFLKTFRICVLHFKFELCWGVHGTPWFFTLASDAKRIFQVFVGHASIFICIRICVLMGFCGN